MLQILFLPSICTSDCSHSLSGVGLHPGAPGPGERGPRVKACNPQRPPCPASVLKSSWSLASRKPQRTAGCGFGHGGCKCRAREGILGNFAQRLSQRWHSHSCSTCRKRGPRPAQLENPTLFPTPASSAPNTASYWARAARMATRHVQRGLASWAWRAVPPAAFRRLPLALRCQRCQRRMGCCLSGSAANGSVGSSAAARLAASGHIYDALLPAGNQLRSALAFRFSPSSLCPWVDGALLPRPWGMSHGPWHA